MLVKNFAILLLIILGLTGCATDDYSYQSSQRDKCALAGRAFMYSCMSRR